MRSASSSSAEIKLRKLNKEKIIKQIVREIMQLRGILCAVLFGSLAEDKYTGSSDADVLLVIEKSIPMAERYRRYNRIMADTEVQLFILTLDEVMSRIDSGDTFVINIIMTGIPLMGEEIYRRIRERCEIAIRKYGLRRTNFGWVCTKGKSE